MEKSTETNGVYEEFEPSTAWQRDATYDTLIVHLPGFKKEQLKVQITTSRKLRVSGERQKGKDKWSKFQLEISTPSNYDINQISAKFENAALYIKHPKVITPAAEEPNPPTATENQNPKPQSNGQEPAATETAPSMEKQQSRKPKQELQALMKNEQEEPKPKQELQALMKNGQEEPKPKQEQQALMKNGQEEPKPKQEQQALMKNGQEEPSQETVPGTSLERKNEELEGATMEGEKGGDEKMENEAAAETSNVRDKPRVVENFKQAFGVLVREMKHSRKIMNLIVAILFVLVAVIYARNVMRSIGKSQG